MNKHLSSPGPIALRRIRSLLGFWHENPAARLAATPMAFVIATLLLLGSGAAYADSGVLDAGVVLLLGSGLLVLLTGGVSTGAKPPDAGLKACAEPPRA